MRALLTLTLMVLLLLAAAPASARDPGRWQLTGYTSVPIAYWQGITSAPAGRMFFSGPVQGLYRTLPGFDQTGALDPAIPATVAALEGYNHVGDISWHRAEGGRVLLPLECYVPGGPNGGNTCGTGAIGVADPATLAMRYYVKLDPAEIAKAMWVESSPDGRLLWTSSGDDLLAYRATDVSAAKASPGAPPIRAVRRLPGAVPPSGVTGAAFHRGRLFLAGASGSTYQVWSVDPAEGRRRLELELPDVEGEAEGLNSMALLNGRLHWLVAPLTGERAVPASPRSLAKPTFGPTVGLLHLSPVRGRVGLRVGARATAFIKGRQRISVRVTRRGRAVEGARVTLADALTRTDAGGRATLTPRPFAPGSYAALARWRGLRGVTRRFRLGWEETRTARAAGAPRRPLR